MTTLKGSQRVRLTAEEVRAEYGAGRRDFHEVDLSGVDLSGSDLSGASFYCAILIEANLSDCWLTHTQFKGANLTDARLNDSMINATDLIAANFKRSDLSRSHLLGASLGEADLSGANLSFARLDGASLRNARLAGARFRGAKLFGTHFQDVDIGPLCAARQVQHQGPSSIDARTVIKSFRHPGLKEFMIKCGTPALFADFMIECAGALSNDVLRNLMQSTFISYGGPDESFAQKLYDALQSHGVIVFYFPVTATVGERINDEVFRNVNRHDRVLLVCSRKSLDRPGVVNEIQETLDREARDGGATYLLPITLDGYVFGDWKKTQP